MPPGVRNIGKTRQLHGGNSGLHKVGFTVCSAVKPTASQTKHQTSDSVSAIGRAISRNVARKSSAEGTSARPRSLTNTVPRKVSLLQRQV
jgi:hypothetical protein